MTRVGTFSNTVYKGVNGADSFWRQSAESSALIRWCLVTPYGGAEVSANDRMPKGFPRTSHSHRHRQQTQHRAVWIVIPFGKRLINLHTGEMFDVAGPGYANYRMEQQAAAHSRLGPLG